MSILSGLMMMPDKDGLISGFIASGQIMTVYCASGAVLSGWDIPQPEENLVGKQEPPLFVNPLGG